MKLKATLKFENTYDREIGKPRKAGEIFETSEDRAKLLIQNGYAVVAKEKKNDSNRETSDN